ncbi:hypothetical protein [Aporhodopirellula aestuarii]|uniref:Secreted protein n=1 Tax=Aporhodopirellula aestuarii TaxID=2950107 RepID=A0ABT0UC10_9BACT|nr:hypothetical protein [Aporhodopirellula aestuarii]MCM2374316.1 hypothetical protein [Aporhodopirellula aestuarii]
MPRHQISSALLLVVTLAISVGIAGVFGQQAISAEPVGRSIGSEPAGLADSITAILPADTMLWINTPDWASTAASLNKLPMIRLMATKEMQPFREQTDRRSKSYLIDSYGLDFEQIDREIAGEFIIAGLTTEEGELSITCFVQTPNATTAEAFVKATAILLNERGAKEETPATSGTVQLALKNIDEQLVLATLGNHAMISGDVGIARQLIDRWQKHSAETSSTANSNESSPSDRLVDKAGFNRTILELQDSPPTLLRWYLDPIAFAVASEKTANAKEELSKKKAASTEPTTQIPFPMRHGFPGLQSIAGRAWINQTTGNLESRTLIHAPTRENALEMFQFDPGTLGMPSWVSDEANVATIVRWNLDEMISHVEDVYDDVTDAPGAFAGTMQDLKTELKVDLLDGLFPVIGPEVVIYSTDDAKQNIESTVVSIEIQDPAKNEQSVAAMMYNMFVGDPEARRIRLPGKRYEMWQIKLVVDEDTTPFTKAGLIVADGRLWFCTHASTLQKLILQRKKSPLTDTAVYRVFEQVIADERHADSIGVSIARMDRDARNTYEVLRSQGVKGLEKVESVYATMLRSIFLRDDTQEKSKTPDQPVEEIDFSVMPSYDFVRNYLNNLAVISRNTDTGWEIFAVAFEEDSE